MFRTDDMYGNFPTLEEIKRDYREFVEMVGDVTTVERAKEWNMKGKFTIEANGMFLNEFIDNGGKDSDLEWLRYESYGCLAYIYVRIGHGMVESIWFDVWCNEYDSEFITDVTIESLTDENYEKWVTNRQE